ncbi:hypothetical protein SK128_009973 [Halocaridina rubra]|uniref:Uncharacterized protein n=1 Tax=Halocaridina rubra TaxID=373956 RepID=A0AAN9AHQ2_HALRR
MLENVNNHVSILTELPTTGQSKEFIIPNDFQVPQPGDVCGSYFLIFTLSEGQETVPYSQFPVSRTKECSEDVDLAWAMSGDANELSLSLASENNLQVLGSISGLSITNDGATDLAIRSAMDAPEVFAFVTQATAWNVWNIFNENNYTLEEAVDELVAVELPYFNGYSMGNSKTLNGWSMLMVETQGDNSRALPRGDSVEVAFSDLSASAFSVCNYNMLVLIIDPFNKTKDSNRTNNVFMAPLMAMCDTESGDDSCEVIPDLEEDGRSAMLLSWNYGFPSAYMFTERNGKSGFSPLEYDEMNDKIIESMMTKEHFNRLTALGLCSQGQNEAENAVNESLANGGLQLIKTVRNSLAALTPLGDIATSEHDKVLKMMDLADAVLSQALDRDGPVRFILLKFLAKKIIRNIRGILTMSDSMGRGSDFGDMDGGDFGWMEEEDGMMGPGFGGMGGPHGMGRPARPPGMGGFDFEGTGRPFGMGSDFGGMGRPSGMGNSDFGGMGRPSGMGNSDFGGMGRPSGMGNPDFGGMGRPSGMGNSGFEGMGRPSGMGNPDFEGMGRPSGMGNPDFEGMGRPSGMGNSGFEGMGRPSGMGNSGFEGMGRPSGMGNSDFEGMGRPSGMGRPESSGTRPNQEDNPRQPDMPRPTTGTEEFGGFDSLGPEEADSDCDTVYCFAYGSNICLPDSWLCDGTNDCSNGADEEDCTEIGTPFGTDALHKGPQNIHAEKLQSVVSTLLRGNRENSFRGIPGFFGGENSDGFPRGPPRFPPFRGGMPDFSNLNGSLLNQIFNLTSLNTTFNASALAALFNNTFNMTKHPHGHGPFGKHPLFNGAFNASAFAALFNGTVNASDLAALLNSSFNASAFATLFNTTNFGGFGGGFGHHDFSSAGFPPFGPGPRRRPRTRGSRRQSSRDSGSGFGGPWRQPREPMRMYSENVNRRRGSNSHGEMNKGSGGRKSLLKQMIKKIIMRLATGTSAEDLDELSFFDLPTRQLVKDVYDILTTDGCPKVFLPYKMVARNGEMEPMQ